MKRRILLIAICYLIGTIGGLYFSKNMLLFFYTLLLLCLLVSNKKSFMVIIYLAFFISSLASIFRLSYINRFYQSKGEVFIEGKVKSVREDEYYNKIEVQVYKFNGNDIKLKIKFYVYVKKNDNTVKEGDYIQVYGEFSELQESRNYGGFNYRRYLQSKQVFGIVNTDNIRIKLNKKVNLYQEFITVIRKSIKGYLYTNLPKKNAELCIALMIGEKEFDDEKITDEFSDAGLSHILAISGMHVAYVASLTIFISKTIVGRRKSNYIAIIALVFFCNLAHNSESVFRATVMLSLYYIAKLLHRKSDSLTNLAISTIFSLILNPFCIYNTSFVMSSLGTLGIICLFKHMNNKKLPNKIISYIKEQINLGISANLALAPATMIYFNKLSLIFFISSPIINITVGAIMPTLILFVMCCFLPQLLKEIFSGIISKIVVILTNCLMYLASLFSKFHILNFITTTPQVLNIVIYYIILLLVVTKINCGKINQNIRRITKLIFVIYAIVCITYKTINLIDSNMKIYFVDVGQGDCTLIVTPNKKKILIDGGGSELGEDTVGKNILLPYLLDRKVKSLDYIFFSHFDSDHCGRFINYIRKYKSKTCSYG